MHRSRLVIENSGVVIGNPCSAANCVGSRKRSCLHMSQRNHTSRPMVTSMARCAISGEKSALEYLLTLQGWISDGTGDSVSAELVDSLRH